MVRTPAAVFWRLEHFFGGRCLVMRRGLVEVPVWPRVPTGQEGLKVLEGGSSKRRAKIWPLDSSLASLGFSRNGRCCLPARRSFTRPYRRQTNGKVERLIQSALFERLSLTNGQRPMQPAGPSLKRAGLDSSCGKPCRVCASLHSTVRVSIHAATSMMAQVSSTQPQHPETELDCQIAGSTRLDMCNKL